MRQTGEIEAGTSFQERVRPWMMACFGEAISADRVERNHRFLEESLELAQANGCTRSEALQLVDYVFGRPVGEVNQEIGGVMVTLAALCLAIGEDMQAAGETELARIWTKVEAIRAKQAAKPKHSPLPQHVSPDAAVQAAFCHAFTVAFSRFSSPEHRLADMHAFMDEAWQRYSGLIGVSSGGVSGRKEWRCFHCDESFTDVEAARTHFGDSEYSDPICCMKPEDVRAMERELERYRMEDSDKDREFHAMRADHARALRVEEEKGYEKGLRDGESLFGKPYAWEFGKSNGDGTFSVVIERDKPGRPSPDWPLKALYVREEPKAEVAKPARFGHFNDPVEDYLAEVSLIECEVGKLGAEPSADRLREVDERIFRAMSFRVGAVEDAVSAKNRLRLLEKDLAAFGYVPGKVAAAHE